MAMFGGIKRILIESLILNIGLPVMFITICKLLIYEKKFDIFQISVLYLRFVFVVLTSQYHPVNFGDYFTIKKNVLVYGIVLPSFCLYLRRLKYTERGIEKRERLVDYFDNVFFYLGLDLTNKCLNGSIRRWYIQMRYGIPKLIFNLIFWIAFLFLSYLLKCCISSVTGGLVIKTKEYNSPSSLVNEYKESFKIFDTSQEAILKPKYIQRIITHHGTYRELFSETSPAYEIQYHRFPGEDIKLKCEWILAKHKTSNLKVAVWRFTKWTMVGLKNIEYDLNQTRQIESTKYYQTDSFSRILINSEDFGVYYLWHLEIYEDVMHSHLVCKFELKKSEVMTEYIQVPVGDFLILGHHIFHTFANISDLTVVYKVQSVAIGGINLTTNEISSKCSYWTNIYKDYRNNNYTLTTSMNSSKHIVIVNGGTCVSSKLYGINHLSIVRKLFEETSTNRRFLGEEEIVLRHRYLVHPGRTFLNLLYKKESKQFSENDFPSISDIIDQERLWTIRQGIEGTLILFFFITGWLLVTKLYNYVFYFASVFMNLFSKVKKVEHFSDFINDIEFIKDIDCLLISAENERQYNNLISSCLEGEKLKVCIPDRDFDVNGQSIKLFSQATSTALSFVIICSTDLVHDSFLNTYVITDMILNRLKDKSIREINILIIKTDIQRLPTSLLKYKQVQYFDFSKNFLNELDKKDMILCWAQSRFKTAKLTYYTIFFRWFEAKWLQFYSRHKSIAWIIYICFFFSFILVLSSIPLLKIFEFQINN